MDTSRNRVSNVICVVFSVTLALLVCFSIGIRFGIDNMVSRAIIAAVYCGIVVGLAFALNKVVNRANNSKLNLDENRLFAIAVIVDAVLFIVLRLLVISDVLKIDFKLSNVFDMAKIGSDGRIYFNVTNLDSIIATKLSCMFKLFGNTFFPIYLIQFIISAIAFALIIISVNKIFGKFSSIVTGFGFAVLPVFVKAIASDGADNLVVLFFAIILIFTAKYKDIIERDNIKIGLSLLIGIITGFFSLYSALLMLAILIPIAVLLDCRSEYLKDRVLNTVVMILGNIVTFGAALLIDSYLVTRSGVEGFVNELLKHINYRFGFSVDFSLLKWGLDDTGLFLVMILCIIYCVIYWKNDEDSAHISSLFIVAFVLQLIGIGAYNHDASMMILSIALLIIGGHGIGGLGYDNSYSGVYRIDDDMQPAIIESIGDKKINPPAEEVKTAVEVQEVKEEVETQDVEETSKIDETIVEEEAPKAEEIIAEEVPKAEETIVKEEAPKAEESLIVDEVGEAEKILYDENKSVIEENNNDEEDIQVNETEVVKDGDDNKNYGINNADFESLFNVTSTPPKFVYNNIYSEDEVVATDEVNLEDETSESEDAEIEEFDELVTTVEANDAVSDEMVEEEIKVEEDKAKDDAKAYVDTFFGYLYNNDSSEFEAFEPLKPLDDLPVVEEKEEQQEYVSHADNFADLDIDLGVDAFDNVVLYEEKTAEISEETAIELSEEKTTELSVENSEDSSEDEFFFDEITVENETITDWEPISVESFEDEEDSIEAMLEEKINRDFSYEEALNRKIDNEEIEKEIGFSYEQAIEKKLEVEEAISNALAKEEFSYEEAYRNKLWAEDVVEEAVIDDNISVVSSIESKLDIENDIENNAIQEEFSYQEAIETKLDVEKMIEDATTDKILEEFESEELLEGVVFDFGEKSLSDENKSEIEVDNSNEYDSTIPVLEVIQESSIEISQESVAEELQEAVTEELLESDIEESRENVIEETSTEVKSESVIEDSSKNSSDDENVEEIQFIENPLPLPKKHVHREMDYGRVIPSAWMHFDIELDNKNNHYDI